MFSILKFFVVERCYDHDAGESKASYLSIFFFLEYATLVKDVIKDTVRAWQQKEGKANSKELNLEEFQKVVWERIFSDLQNIFDVLQVNRLEEISQRPSYGEMKIQEKVEKMQLLEANTPA